MTEEQRRVIAHDLEQLQLAWGHLQAGRIGDVAGHLRGMENIGRELMSYLQAAVRTVDGVQP